MPNNVNDFITFLTFLFYGLVFFTAGVAITSKVTRSSKLTIARHLPLFAMNFHLKMLRTADLVGQDEHKNYVLTPQGARILACLSQITKENSPQ